MVRLLPRVLLVTALVAVVPVVAVWGLESSGDLTSPVLTTALSALLSLAIYQVAARVWQRREGTGDVLFSDLLLWGFVHRCLQERRLASAVRMLEGVEGKGWKAPTDLALDERVAVLERLAGALEARDKYTHGHSRRVTRYSAMIAEEMGVDGGLLRTIRTAAALHDIGKIETPLEVLGKPGKLTREEFGQIELHPVDGERMVEILGDPTLSAIVRSHHERLDGSGYPDGLRGETIPLGARIVAVADTFDAITSTRSYRPAKPHKPALDIIRQEAGCKLDAAAVDAFCRAYLTRRPTLRWIALTDLAERALVWLTSDAIGSGARVAAVAAGAVAVGSGALPLHAAVAAIGSGASGGGRASVRVASSREGGVDGVLVSTSASTSGGGGAASAASRPGGSVIGSVGERLGGTRGTGQPVAAAPGSVGPAGSGGTAGSAGAVTATPISVGSSSGSGTGTGSAGGTETGPGRGVSAGTGNTAGTGTSAATTVSDPTKAPPVTLTVATPSSAPATVTISTPSAGRPTTGAGATVGNSGSAAPSAGVSATVGSGSSTSAGVTVGTGTTAAGLGLPKGIGITLGGKDDQKRSEPPLPLFRRGS